MGLMQLIPETAALVGVTNPFDPWDNVMGGARYLRMMLNTFGGDRSLALAAYNAGPGAVRGAVPNIPETRAYVKRVLALVESYEIGS